MKVSSLCRIEFFRQLRGNRQLCLCARGIAELLLESRK
jgi:hypothetical protein